MKTKTIITWGVMISSTLCISCENLIETDFPINQLNVDQVFESVGTADGALSALYADIQSSSLISGGPLGAGALLGSYADDIDGYDNSSSNAAMDIFNNIQLSSNTTIKMVWANAYREIYMANSIIIGIENSSTISEKDKKRIKGEALFIRSIIYFYLTEIFGDIPYTTSIKYTENQSILKTPGIQVLNLVTEDLKKSVLLLDDAYRNNDRIYVNRKTAEMLLAILYSRQKNWINAENILKNILQNEMYVWQPDITKTFKKDSKHILWQLKPLFANNATPEALLYSFTSNTPKVYAASENFISSFATGDLRKQMWLTPFENNQHTYYKIAKYKNTTSNTDEFSVVFRLEETYLLLAEILAEQNKLQESLQYLNPVRQKAGLPILTGNLTQDEIKTQISAESRKEFFTERGIRFLNLKRNNKLENLSLSKPNWKIFHHVWPLPLSELSLNPNLNPQNTGY